MEEANKQVEEIIIPIRQKL